MTENSDAAAPTTPAGTAPAHDRAAVHDARHVDDTEHGRYEAVRTPLTSRRHDLVSWGAVWAGLVVTLALFLLLEFVFFSLGWLEFARGATGTTAGLISALLAVVAFLVGGLTAGATSVWRDGKGGLFHGIVLWALGIVSIIFLTLFGGGALFGSLAGVLTQASQIQQAVNVPDVQLEEALSDARSGAVWAAVAVLLPLVAAALGGLLGGKLGSRAPDATTDATTLR
jgi:cation transport ATPase